MPRFTQSGFFFLIALAAQPGSADAPAPNSAVLDIPHHAVIAHRGASYFAPEESRPSYLMARELGVDYLETDIQRTRDGVLVLVHDSTLERTSNIAERLPGRQKQSVDQLTWKELQRLDFGSWFNQAHPDRARKTFVGLPILKLEDLIQIANSGTTPVGLYLESKDAERYPGMEKQIIDLLIAKNWLTSSGALRPGKRIIFQSFSSASLVEFKKLALLVPRVYLTGEEGHWRPHLETAEKVANGLGPSGYYAWPWLSFLAHRKGMVVHPYVINEPWQMIVADWFGMDGIFTDTSHLALKHYGRLMPFDLAKRWRQLGY